jgi:hypothetical protein
LLTAATAVQIAIALIILTRPSRDDVDAAERAPPATVSGPGGEEQSPAPARTLPFAARKEGFYKRGAAAGSRPRARVEIGGSPSIKAGRPKPRMVPSAPPPPPPRATTPARANTPPPPPSETATAAGRPPPTVARSPGGGGDDDEEDEEDEGDDEDGDDDDGGGDGGGGEDDD